MSLKDVFIIINQVLKAQKASHQNYRYMWKIIDVIMGLLDGASQVMLVVKNLHANAGT